MTRNNPVTSISTLHPVWEVSVDIFPTGITPGWSNILQLSIGDHNKNYGDRVPGIWFRPDTTNLHICGPVDGNRNYYYDSKFPLPLNQWSTVKIYQTESTDGKFQYIINICDRIVHTVHNTWPQVFSDVKVYASNPWDTPAAANITNLKISSFPANYGFAANTLIGNVEEFYPEWKLSMDIYPTGTVSDWTNIFHATIGDDDGNYGDRTPSIWFIGGGTRLHICMAISGDKSKCYDSTPLPIYAWSKLSISQSEESEGFFMYRIEINGTEVYSVRNTWPKFFNNVKLYNSDPWYKPASAMLSNGFQMEWYPNATRYSNRIVKTIPILSPDFTISAKIYPMGKIPGVSSLFHLSTGDDIAKYGDRTPGVWFHSGTTKLYICGAVSNNRNDCKSTARLPLNEWSEIVVTQNTQSDGAFVYTIWVRDEIVHFTVNTWPQEFKSVKVYNSDPWYQPAYAKVENLTIDTYPTKDIVLTNMVDRTIPVLYPTFSIEFNVCPTGTVAGVSSIFHVTTGENVGPYGSRIPGIWFLPHTTKLLICGAVSGNGNYCYTPRTALPLEEWSHVKVSQFQRNDAEFHYTIEIDNTVVHAVENRRPQQFTDLTVYKGDPWYQSALAKVANINIETSRGNLLVTKNTVDRTIPVLNREWELSVDINPTGTWGLGNVLHATVGNDNLVYGDRVPAIWVLAGTTILHICAPVNGNRNYCFNSKSLPVGQWAKVKITQIPSDDGGHAYSITINGEKVHEVENNRAEEFSNVLLYTSDPWYDSAPTQIKNLQFGSLEL